MCDPYGFYPVPMSTEQPPFQPYQPPSGGGDPTPVEAFRCPNCGSDQFNPGFIDDIGNEAVRWIQGPVEHGMLGGLRKMGRARRVVVSYRCAGCSRLELYAGEEA